MRTKISKRIFAESGTKSDLDNFGKIWDTIEFRLYLAESGTKLDLDDFGKVWNDVHTPTAAALAAGSVIDLVHRVAAGSLRSVNHTGCFFTLGLPLKFRLNLLSTKSQSRLGHVVYQDDIRQRRFT